jgi:hypothetical protein
VYFCKYAKLPEKENDSNASADDDGGGGGDDEGDGLRN